MNNRRMRATAGAALALALVLPGMALAHTGHHDVAGGGFATGFSHPFGGWDHMLAMIAVGIWAAQLAGRSVWLLPALFLSGMAAGGALGGLGLEIPLVETGIIASILLLGGLIALAPRMVPALTLAVVAVSGAFHGHAHGAEMPQAAEPLLYGLGFLLATALLHAGGILAALGVTRMAGPAEMQAVAVRGLGALLMTAGMAGALLA